LSVTIRGNAIADRQAKVVLSPISMMKSVNVIDEFVATINRRGLEPLFDDAVPPELRTKKVDETIQLYEWQIRPGDCNPWVSELQERLPFRFPRLYHELISRYRFAEFEVGPIMFLANTGITVFNELARVIYRDDALSPKLLQNGLLQFGRAAGGSYDPVCFDMTRRKSGYAPLVRVDHEAVLVRDRLRVNSELASNFRSFVEKVVAGQNATDSCR
jgi:hypothetical protein